ncbi:MAG: tetratricopeptide repeat protein [Gemmatimonadota bacterium]|nr:tetratricopeptide repeat protein [Gemmatimonadota bacterium]
MSRKRLSKKQLRKDRFVEQTFDWAHWVETHGKQVVGGLVVLVLLIAGFFVWRNMERGAEEQAARDYLQARQAYFAGNFPLAANDLSGFLDRHGGSSYADDAHFFLADAYYKAGQPERAIEELREFFEQRGDSPFTDNARRLLAAVYQQTGRYDQAIETYREAIESAEYDELEIQLRRSLAKVFEAREQTDLAADQYRKIITLEPQGEAADEARRDLAELTVEPLGVVGASTAGGDESPEATMTAEEPVAGSATPATGPEAPEGS